MTEELIFEGIERELVSKIQNMRKEIGLQVTDRIEIYYKASGRALKVLEKAAFAPDVLAVKVENYENNKQIELAELIKTDRCKTLNVNGEEVTIVILN